MIKKWIISFQYRLSVTIELKHKLILNLQQSQPMTVSTLPDETAFKTQMRSGAAARLAGLSPSTLRIWEHRYGVVAPPKSAAGQRSYSMKDIERLRLIKRLTLEGHAIGTVAQLDVNALVLLSAGNPVPSVGAQRVLVVGHAAARKLEGRLRPVSALVFDDLNHAEREVTRAGARFQRSGSCAA